MQTYEYRTEMQSFYNSKEWKRCREAYKRKKGYICERCHNTSNKMIVHHKIKLTPMNMNNPSISLNEEHLELLCIECHNQEHGKSKGRDDYYVDEFGKVVTIQ